jgi:leucyl aminopeptidase
MVEGGMKPAIVIDIVVVEGHVPMRSVLRDSQLREVNVGKHIVFRNVAGGRRDKIIVRFDGRRPYASCEDVASIIASASLDNATRVDVSRIAPEHRVKLRYVTAKHMYTFDQYTQGASPAANCVFVGMDMDLTASDISCLESDVSSMYASADISNEPGNVLPPSALAKRIREWVSRFAAENFARGAERPRCRLLTHANIKAQGLTLIDAVGRASSNAPCMLVIEFMRARTGNRTGNRQTPTIAIAGKGVVFDSGGLALKSFNGMRGMHADKTGAAVATAVFLSACKHAAELDMRVNLVVALPLVENSVSGVATRPGDIVRSCSGMTVEISDTDAEGRLILADAMCYLRRYRPTHLIDFATLTDSGSLTHPNIAACVFVPGDSMWAMADAAGRRVGERVWRMPPWLDDDKDLNSDVADVRNTSGGMSQANGYTASLFLSKFLPESCPPEHWMHVDISRNTASKEGVFVASGVAFGSEFVRRLMDSLMQRVTQKTSSPNSKRSRP